MTPTQLFFHLEKDAKVIIKFTQNLLIFLQKNDEEQSGEHSYICTTQVGYGKMISLFTKEELKLFLKHNPSFLAEAYVGEVKERTISLKWYHTLYTRLLKFIMGGG